jgi:hypothetical protein
VNAVGEPLHLHNVRFDATPAGIGVNNGNALDGMNRTTMGWHLS